MLKDYVKFGLMHWGSDAQGVENTRRFLLEWLSFLCRYVPVGLLERLPARLNDRPPIYHGRSDLETLMASRYVGDWLKLAEMLLGPARPGFDFQPCVVASSHRVGRTRTEPLSPLQLTLSPLSLRARRKHRANAYPDVSRDEKDRLAASADAATRAAASAAAAVSDGAAAAVAALPSS